MKKSIPSNYSITLRGTTTSDHANINISLENGGLICDEFICFGCAQVSLLHKDIGFVEQDNRVPARRDPQKPRQGFFGLAFANYISRVDSEQRPSGQVGDTLCLELQPRVL